MLFGIGVANLVSGLKIWLYLRNEQMEFIDFLQAGTNSSKLKDNWEFLGWVWTKMKFGQSDQRTLEFTVSEEWADGVKCFFYMMMQSHKS